MKHMQNILAFVMILAISHIARAEDIKVNSDIPDVVSDYTAVFDHPPVSVPTVSMPDGPLLGNGDVGVVLAGPPEEQKFYIGKNDFWRQDQPQIIGVGVVTLSIPALHGATYRQEQDLAHAEVRGTFTEGNAGIQTRAWVDANENIFAIDIKSSGASPVDIELKQLSGGGGGPASAVADNENAANIGREQHDGGRWYFDGQIDPPNIEAKCLTDDEIKTLAAAIPQHGGKQYDGRSTFEQATPPPMNKCVSISAWIKIESENQEANYIVSKGDWNQSYSLGLSHGCLRWSINGVYVQTEAPLELHKWIHVAATFDGHRMRAYVDGVVKAQLGGSGDQSDVDEHAGMIWFVHKADKTPTSRTVAVVSRVLSTNVQYGGDGELTITLQPGQSTTVATAILSDLDSRDELSAAKQRAAALNADEMARLAAKHQAWWNDFWSKSFIEIPDKEIEKRWYAALYVMGSCSREGKIAPGLWGNWVTTDQAGWFGDFHLNYNFQAPFYITYASNHADLSMPFYQALIESVPKGREMARRLGWKGVHFPVAIGPWGLRPYGDQDWGQRSDAVFAAMNFIWQYQYTQDEDFLRTTAYPYLREVADFWEDYLKLENGRYVIYNDSIHEASGADFNPIFSLGLLHTLFKNMIQMSNDLGVDADRRVKWQDICDRISAFPTQEAGGKTVFRYSERGMAWAGGNTLGVYHVFPGDAIGLDSDPKLLEISRNTIDAMHRWADFNGFSNWYTVCARVGYDPKIILARLRHECDVHSLPNLILYFGGGGIENCGGFLAINEMLLQSHEGVVRFFPCWPKDQDARFGNLRAVGAFLVSAKLQAGEITAVKITSEKGKDCTVLNPWPGKTVDIVRNGKRSESVTGKIFTLKTQAGESLELGMQSP